MPQSIPQNVGFVPNGPVHPGIFSAGRSVRNGNGEAVWIRLGWAFAAYWVLFAISALAGQRELNSVGAVFVLAILGWAALDRLWVKADGVVVASFAAALFPLLNMLVWGAPQTPDAVMKHVSLCAVIAISRLVPLPAASGTRVRGLLALQILVILALCLTVKSGVSWDGGTRHAGLFTNPNNMALIPFLLLFFIRRSDPLVIRAGAHVVIVGVLAFTGTSGAVIAYAIGLAVHMRAQLSRFGRLLACTLVLAGVASVVFLAVDGDELLPETRLTNQISVMRTGLETVLQGGQIEYYTQERTLGPGSTSGIWRLVHWRRTITTWSDGTPAQLVFGFGLGSSETLLGIIPHNEYLRVLFEQGIAGFVLFIFLWRRIILTAPAGVRYVGLIVAIYSFSENNLDNFPFMSLFALCLSASGLVSHPGRARSSRPWTSGITSGQAAPAYRSSGSTQ